MLFHSLQFTHFSFEYFIGLGRRRLCFPNASDFFYFTCRPVSHVHIQNDSEVHELQPNRYTVTDTCFRLSLVLFAAITVALLLLLLLLLFLLFHFENRLFAKFERVFFSSSSARCSMRPYFVPTTNGAEQNMQKCVSVAGCSARTMVILLEVSIAKNSSCFISFNSHYMREVSCWQLRS